MIKLLWETALTDVAATDIEGVGRLRYGNGGQIYRWVKNRSTTTAIVAKQVVCYNEGNVGASALYESVNEPETENLMLNAGMAVTAIVASASDALCFGWICVQGYFQDALVGGATAVAIGDSLKGANDSNNLALSVATGSAPAYSSHFISLETADSSSLAQATDVYVKCL